jgi:xanthine/uracil/vitamin C permease (AzgA family)
MAGVCSFVSKFFDLKGRNTSVWSEFVASIATFAASSYSE